MRTGTPRRLLLQPVRSPLALLGLTWDSHTLVMTVQGRFGRRFTDPSGSDNQHGRLGSFEWLAAPCRPSKTSFRKTAQRRQCSSVRALEAGNVDGPGRSQYSVPTWTGCFGGWLWAGKSCCDTRLSAAPDLLTLTLHGDTSESETPIHRQRFLLSRSRLASHRLPLAAGLRSSPLSARQQIFRQQLAL
ncbi:hypothetical protein AAT19DRAFT_9466 [Rhodotorula toruloides]|uniref:Uncharacterized protein n=1 Tax=Rhodotorula toruloides TaxID=5286 RepID=A0A2T0A287_RHOTO|nr:hypothetical protein AAT19DRAFT_9466 [Rhodotorula toruloides]